MKTLLRDVEAVARAAGDEALRHFRTAGLEVEFKADGSPVTQADRSAEDVARAAITARFPHDAIRGEEHGGSESGERTWYVDPIDGTKAFVRGVPLWGTLIAVAEGPELLASAMYFPAMKDMVVAARGEGAWHNAKRCHVSHISRLAEATVLTTEAKPGLMGLARIQSRAAVSRTWGDCYGYLLVATGRAEVMIDPTLEDWDSAALLPIIEEAGGTFTDIRGTRTGFGKSAVATNRELAAEVKSLLAPVQPSKLEDFVMPAPDALVMVVTVHDVTGEVMMVAHANRASLEQTRATGFMHYHSRRRGLWKKGETSGNTQVVVSLHWDCDGDAIVARVLPNGPACHTGDATCFSTAPAPDALTALDRTLAERASTPGEGYTRKLLADDNLRLKKLGEETAELLIALALRDDVRVAEEAADLLYHTLVAARALGAGLDDVRRVLANRAAVSAGAKPAKP